MKKTMFLLPLCSALFLAACGETASNEPSAASHTQAANVNDFHKNFVTSGISGCVKEAGEANRAVCECAINRLNNELNEADIVNISKGRQPADMKIRVKRAIESCQKSPKSS